MIIDVKTYLAHYGTPRHSGRYPWGSGDENATRNRTFLDDVAKLRKQGMSATEIAKSFNMTTTQLRAAQSIAGNQQKVAKIAQAEKLRAKGLSNKAIGERMGGLNESSVRSLLAPGQKERAEILMATSNMLKRQVEEKKFIDIGAGVENQLQVSSSRLNNAVAVLKQEGYVVHPVQVDQQGTQTKTTVKVLCPPGTTYREAVANKYNIRQITEHSEDRGRTMLGIHPPISIDSKRIGVRYGEDGGKAEDGTIFVRPGVKDVSIGANRYAQVRVAVDGTHFIKGMAIYKDDLPDGVDLVFNTPKSNTGNKLDVFKKLEDEPDNPFGSVINQITEVGPDGKRHVVSAMNMVGSKEGAGAEGSWDTWSKSLSTQVLSKQSPKLAKQQLDLTYAHKKQELEEIKELTNPVVRKKLLEAYADGADSSAVHLEAAHLPRQATRVLLPVPSLKETQIYAPNFDNGEQVALIRYPHGGTFEIPILTVNNKHAPSRKLLGHDAKDAVGINPKVAERLSGADFDGDTVVVIPNKSGHIKSTPALKALQGFDPQVMYKPHDGMHTIDGGIYNAKTKSVDYGDKHPSPRGKSMQMGLVSNLITDMTIKGASPDELARAVKHSMVVIDAEKHHLDYKRSAIDNGIKQLSAKYQGREQGGSSTLISRAKSEKHVDFHKLRSPREGGPIDPKTGKKVYEKDPQSYTTRDGRVIVKKRKSTKLAETDDAFTLVDDLKNPIEVVYAEHSNRMKQLANDARKEVAAFKPPLISRSAKQTHAADVASLNAKINLARRNKPLERQAQVVAGSIVSQKIAANPHMDPSDLKKIKFQALAEARIRTGAAKFRITPSPSEWAAIQAGAITHHQLKQILDNADLDVIKQLATPRNKPLMSATKTALANSMLSRGYTQREVALHLGVSLSTLQAGLE